MNALNSFIGQKERPQVVRTPTNILDAVDQTFGVNRWVDVYPDPGSEATTRGAWREGMGWCAVIPGKWDAHDTDPLHSWPFRSYCNPEYKTLREAMTRAAREGEAHSEILMLCPARPRRDWWCDLALGTHIAWLKPVFFPGYVDKHGKPTSNPENMVVIGWLEDPTHIENFYLAFRKLSNHIAHWK